MEKVPNLDWSHHGSSSYSNAKPMPSFQVTEKTGEKRTVLAYIGNFLLSVNETQLLQVAGTFKSEKSLAFFLALFITLFAISFIKKEKF